MTETVITTGGVQTTFAYAHLMSVEHYGVGVSIVLVKDGVRHSPMFQFDEEAIAEECYERIQKRWGKWLAKEGDPS